MRQDSAVPDVVEIEGLEKRYGGHPALRGLDLRVPEGVVYGFLGPNGSGKTTTMRILLGLLRTDAGRVRLLGGDPWAEGARVRQEVGYLPSGAGLFGRMRGAQLLDHLSRLDGRPPVLRERACRALRLSDADLDRQVRTYSRGMRQKLGLVTALQHDPRLLVLDEPTEGLDPLVQEGLLELLRERRAAGRTVLFSSHVLSEVEELCDRAAIVRAGRIVREGTIEALRAGRGRRVRLVPADGQEPPRLPDAELVETRGRELVYRHAGPVAALLAALAGLRPEEVSIETPRLEEIFLDEYRDEAVGQVDRAAATR